MLTNKAIEEIRKTRHVISAKYHHHTKALIEHYKQLESKYPDRIYGKKRLKKISKVNDINIETVNPIKYLWHC